MPVFCRPKTPKLAYLLLLRRRSFLFALAIIAPFLFLCHLGPVHTYPCSISAALSSPSSGSFAEQRLVIELTRCMTSGRGQKRYLLFMDPQTLLRFENCSFVCCLRGVGFMSSSRVVRSFHGTVFFGSPLAFLRVVKICFRYNLFLEASQWACFVVASFSRPYFFGSSFRQLSYIQDINKSTFPVFVPRGSRRPKQYGEGRPCQN